MINYKRFFLLKLYKGMKKRYDISDTDAFMLFRWLLILVTLLVVGYNADGFKSFSIAYTLAIIYFLINIGLRIFIGHLIVKQTGLFLMFLMDVSFVTLAVYFTAGLKTDFYLIYFLTILMTSIESSLKASIPTAIVAAVLYGWIYTQTHGNENLFTPAFLIKIPFFFLVAFFSGFWADRMRKKIKQTEEESHKRIVQLKEYYKNILESIPSCIAAVDKNMNVTLANAAFKAFDRENIMNLNKIRELKPIADTLKDTIEGKPADRKELVLSMKDGYRYVGITTSIVKDFNGSINGGVAIFRDYTNMKELEERAKRNERLAHMGRMASWIAHEIRNPLGVIKGLNKMLPQVDVHKKIQEYSIEIEKQVVIIDNIIEDVLNFAKQSPGGTEAVDVIEIMNTCINDIKKVHNDVKIRFERHGNNTLINAKRENLVRIFNNLIINATESMGRKPEIDISVVENHSQISVLIQDYGPGIPEEIKYKIFEPFFTTKKKGTGLGLSIVQKLVDVENGKIRWFSKSGEGTLFHLSFPKIGIVK